MPDRRETIPLALIDPAPWNPKYRIAGPARDGLKASLDHFGVRDDLKVWPNPESPGRYIALDGNQRLDVLKEGGTASVECRILADLDDEDAKLFTASFDRNKAYYHENKLGVLAASLSRTPEPLKLALLRLPAVNLPASEPKPEGESRLGDPIQATVPMLFSLTREGFEEVRAGILKCKAKLKREERLREALGALDSREIDDLTVELALRIASSER